MLTPESFRDYLFSVCGISLDSKILVGVSGGIDSIVLCNLLKRNQISFGIAHVNYGLRGKESDEDEQFVAEFSKNYDVPFYLRKCTETDFSSTGENSIQFAARKIRYEFFEEISKSKNYSFIATAHHLDDSIETALLNFARGTGVAGLRSIQTRKEKIIRPLLFTNRLEISEYANANYISWREDSSNESDKYSRNRIRHHLLPWLMSEIPQGYAGFESSFSKLSSTEDFISTSLLYWQNKCCEILPGEIKISIPELNQFPNPELFLKFYLLQHNFSEAQLSNLSDLLAGESGTQLISESFRLIKDRTSLFLIPKKSIEQNSDHEKFKFAEEKFSGKIISDDFLATIDKNTITQPLQIRTWKVNDKMIPFGMKGHRNISDILNDLKLPLHKKENAQLVVSGEEIVWVPGYRIAEKFKVNDETSTVIILSYLK